MYSWKHPDAIRKDGGENNIRIIQPLCNNYDTTKSFIVETQRLCETASLSSVISLGCILTALTFVLII